MHISARKAGSPPYRTSRWLRLALIGLLSVAVIALLALAFARRSPGNAQRWLRIAPATGLIDADTRLTVVTGGWRGREEIAICLVAPGDDACDERSAVQLEASNADGYLEAVVLAGPLLLEGRNDVLLRGLKSNQTLTQSFRALRAVDSVSIAAHTPTVTPTSDAAAAAPTSDATMLATAPPGTAQGWRGDYFTNPDLTGEPALVRDDPDPNFDWGDSSPDPAIIPADGFSARWTRRIEFTAGLHRFVLTANDGARLLLDGQPVLDAWSGQAGQQVTAEQMLDSRVYDVTLEFRNLQGPARLMFGWSAVNAASPVQVADQPSPTATFTPEAQATVALTTPTPSAQTATATATADEVTATPTVTTALNSTTTPTASAGNGATATSAATAASTTTPTATAGNGATITPTATVATTATAMPPGSVRRIIDLNPLIVTPGQQVTVTSGNWSPGIVLRVALAEYGKSYTQSVDLSGVSFTTPLDSSQSWSFRFNFPNSEPWISQVYPIQVWIHTANWNEWAWDQFDLEAP